MRSPSRYAHIAPTCSGGPTVDMMSLRSCPFGTTPNSPPITFRTFVLGLGFSAFGA